MNGKVLKELSLICSQNIDMEYVSVDDGQQFNGLVSDQWPRNDS